MVPENALERSSAFVPRVMEEFITLYRILSTKASIGRYGDGEFRSAMGSDLKFQRYDAGLTLRLREILRAPDDNFLVGIPRVWGRRDLGFYDPIKNANWMRCMDNPNFMAMLDPTKTYWSSFITRPDAALHIECDDYWNLARSIWAGRRVVYFTGKEGKSAKGMARGFLSESKELVVEDCLPKNAWFEYASLIERVKKYDPKKWLVLLSMGPTATVLAYDFFRMGYQTLDIGHMPMFYSREHIKSPQYLLDLVEKYKSMGKKEEAI